MTTEPATLLAERHSGHWGSLLCCTLMLLVAYLFSPILIMLLDHHGYLPEQAEDAFEIFIAPLAWLYHNVAWFKAFYDLILGFCGIS